MSILKFKNEIARGLDYDYFKLRKFQNKIELNIEAGSYVVKTATSKQEVIASLQLRHEVFYKELRQEKHSTGLDIDKYDNFFDHLVVIDKKNESVVATYRLYSTEDTSELYSNSEFDLTDLTQLKGPFLEMGRACIHKNYRRSIILNLLWRGIAEYLKLSNSQYLMGCGSIKTEDAKTSALLSGYFQKQGYTVKNLNCPPRRKYKFKNFAQQIESSHLNTEASAEVESLIPPLLKSYLKIGAEVFLEPALDKDFKCVDYLVLLNREKIVSVYGKKYDLEENKNA